MVGLAVCLVYRVIKCPIRVIEPAKWNRVPDSSVGYRHGPTLYDRLPKKRLRGTFKDGGKENVEMSMYNAANSN